MPSMMSLRDEPFHLIKQASAMGKLLRKLGPFFMQMQMPKGS
jgi:hypothetical protein